MEQCAVDVKFVHPSFCCREANESLNWLHDRMPAILPDEEAVSAWLNQDLHGFEALKVLQSLPGFEKKSAVSYLLQIFKSNVITYTYYDHLLDITSVIKFMINTIFN